MSLQDMTPYDRRAWEELERWRQTRLSAQQRHLVPEPIRRRAGQVGMTVREKAEDIPGVDQFVETFRRSLDGLLSLISKTAEASLRRSAVVKAYAKRGHPVDALEQIRTLELREVDKVKPRLGLRYTAASTLEGQAVPVLGVALGAGPNARLLSWLTDDADRLYRERFLRERYRVEVPVPANSVATADLSVIAIAEIVEAELQHENGAVPGSSEESA